MIAPVCECEMKATVVDDGAALELAEVWEAATDELGVNGITDNGNVIPDEPVEVDVDVAGFEAPSDEEDTGTGVSGRVGEGICEVMLDVDGLKPVKRVPGSVAGPSTLIGRTLSGPTAAIAVNRQQMVVK